MGKGGGGSQPTQTTAYQTNLPEYAQPYVETMLGATQRQLFNTTPGTDGGPDQITGFKPYQPYSTNVNDYFAGPSPMQQQSYQGMANMQVAPQLAQGSQLAGTAGIGSLGLGTQAAGAGANYAQMATDPNSVRAYMSPYMQNVVDTQKAEAFRDYEKGLGALNARAVGAGAFGGNRAALERAEAGRNLATQLGNIQAQGTQNAFQAAQQAQQYGAGLGLQGYGQGLQAASTLGQLGQTGFGQQQAINQAQQQVGAVQQAQGHAAPRVRVANRWAIWFVPLSLALAAATWLISGNVQPAIAVLVAATPCPLILAVPIAIISGISNSAKYGAIIKDEDIDDELASIEDDDVTQD